MTAKVVNPATAKELTKLLTRLVNACSETTSSLISRPVAVQTGSLQVTDAASLTGSLARPNAAIRGAMDKQYAGNTLVTLLEVQDAIAMAGLLMMTPEETIEELRSKQVLEGEMLEAFRELGNVLSSSFDQALRDSVDEIGLRAQDVGLVGPGAEQEEFLPDAELVSLEFAMTVGDYPTTTGRILVAKAVAEQWNRTPLQVGGTHVELRSTSAANAQGSPASTALEEDADIPPAAIRGVLNAYLAGPEVVKVVRQSCRRVGLELRRFNRSDIPNPAAHRNEIVLMDVPAGEERRFDWCKRLRDFGVGVRVVLLLHRPSRARVVQGFLAEANVILGLPVEEPTLSQKLDKLLAVEPQA